MSQLFKIRRGKIYWPRRVFKNNKISVRIANSVKHALLSGLVCRMLSRDSLPRQGICQSMLERRSVSSGAVVAARVSSFHGTRHYHLRHRRRTRPATTPSSYDARHLLSVTKLILNFCALILDSLMVSAIVSDVASSVPSSDPRKENFSEDCTSISTIKESLRRLRQHIRSTDNYRKSLH